MTISFDESSIEVDKVQKDLNIIYWDRNWSLNDCFDFDEIHANSLFANEIT